eukprot:TRINITY_DN1679_c0_g1_i1.p1 TRINITY_DN1679_c0_g1~~TRINITY_DN1679_c0_g1_i1.p1  ORF type:complete len:234 (-),score=13.17 TRINITY_DN1679_c0_g1_i1:85-786(-)
MFSPPPARAPERHKQQHSRQGSRKSPSPQWSFNHTDRSLYSSPNHTSRLNPHCERPTPPSCHPIPASVQLLYLSLNRFLTTSRPVFHTSLQGTAFTLDPCSVTSVQAYVTVSSTSLFAFAHQERHSQPLPPSSLALNTAPIRPPLPLQPSTPSEVIAYTTPQSPHEVKASFNSSFLHLYGCQKRRPQYYPHIHPDRPLSSLPLPTRRSHFTNIKSDSPPAHEMHYDKRPTAAL